MLGTSLKSFATRYSTGSLMSFEGYVNDHRRVAILVHSKKKPLLRMRRGLHDVCASTFSSLTPTREIGM
jgi:hypothetical protein